MVCPPHSSAIGRRIRKPLTPHAWGTEGTEPARMMWVYGGPDPFADSTYLEGEPPKQLA